MNRPLLIATGDAIMPALRRALGGGPAVLPRPGAAGTVAAASAVDAELPSSVPTPIALVVETSGSTGSAKRVALRADALLAGAAAADAALGGPGQWLRCLPGHYIAGLNVMIRSIAAGTEPVELDQRFGAGFTAAGFVEAASRMDWPRRYVSLVPAQLSLLLDAPEAHAALTRFDALLVGGQATPAALVERARAVGARVVRSYGSSETSGGCVYDGVPLAGVDVSIVDGEVWIAGPVLADGYLGDEALTAERFVDGRYRTGDLGELVDGVLTVTGRLDDVIISGGLKVSLAAVERAVRELPGLATALVVRGPHPRWGEVPVLVVTERDGPIDLEAVRTAVEPAVGAAGRPDRLLVVAGLPMLPTGKPDRRALEVRAAG